MPIRAASPQTLRPVEKDAVARTAGVGRGAPQADEEDLAERLRKAGQRAVVGGMVFLSGVTSAFAQTVRGEAPPEPVRITRFDPSLAKPIPQDASKVARTSAYEVHLASRLANGILVPDLRFLERTVADPEPRARVSTFTSDALHRVDTAASFKALLDQQMQEHAAFLSPDKDALHALLPAADRNSFAMNNIRGQRAARFFDEMNAALARTNLAGAELAAAKRALGAASVDHVRRPMHLDAADTKSYWSYGKDQPFVKVWEKVLASLPEGDPRRVYVQAQIDHVFTYNYVISGAVDENDAEKTMGLVAVDRASRRVVSMADGSDDAVRVAYETLEVASGEHAGKAAYKDGGKLFLEGTRTEIQADVKATSTTDVVFRRKGAGEELRAGFRFDWNKNRILDTEKINTGWWGFCDIRGVMEALEADMKGSAGFREFRADTRGVTSYSRDDQLMALASFLALHDDYSKVGEAGRFSLGRHMFAGSRNDDVPTRVDLSLSGGGSARLDVKLSGLSERGDPRKSADLTTTFAPFLPDAAKETFAANPSVLRVVAGDVSVVDGTDRKLSGQIDGSTFDAAGRPVPERAAFELDLTATSGERVLVGSRIDSYEARTATRRYFEPATRSLVEVPVEFVKEQDGYVAKEGRARVLGKVVGAEIARENTVGDGAAEKLAALEAAARTGRKLVQDSDVNEQVWNGAQTLVDLKTEYRSPDGMWERVSVRLDARFGSGKVGEFMVKLNDDGSRAEVVETKAAADFYWSSLSRIAPIVQSGGAVFLNSEMLKRGILSFESDAAMADSLRALQDVTDIIWLGLQATEGKPLHTFVVDGQRFVFDDAVAWRAAAKQHLGTNVEAAQVFDRAIGGGLVEAELGVAAAGAVRRAYVDVDVQHPGARALSIELIAPDGTAVKLPAGDAAGPQGIHGTFGLDLDGAALQALVGKQAAGKWRLKVVDPAGGDAGKLVSWGLQLETDARPLPAGGSPLRTRLGN